MTRPDPDYSFANELLTCPIDRTAMRPIASGPAGHRRQCPRCRLVVVMPRAQLRRAIARDLVTRPPRRSPAVNGRVTA